VTALEASSVRCKTLADGSLDVTLRIEPRDALAAFTLLREPGTPVAIAALKTAEQAQAERAKGGTAAKWLGMRCGEPEFREWLANTFGRAWMAADYVDSVAEQSALVVRSVCGVKSRAEIDNDPAAMERFDRLIRRPWLEHTGADRAA
jgi:hypothetical protein